MLRRKRKTSNGEMHARLSAVRSDFDNLQKDIRGLVSEVGGVALQGAMGNAYESAQKAAGKLEDWSNENLDGVRGAVRNQPLAACILSLGAGAIIGALLSR